MLQQENKVNADVIIAHNVKTSGNVAATFHIEPSHNPKAGERSQAWFALTKQGGELVSLERCNCSLNVYDRQQNSVLQPALKSISAEQYQGIPGAELVFPKAGIYTLELSGRPKDGESFNAFRLTYEVTVQAGAAPQAVISPAESSPSAPSTSWILAGVALPLVALLVGVLWMLKTKQNR